MCLLRCTHVIVYCALMSWRISVTTLTHAKAFITTQPKVCNEFTSCDIFLNSMICFRVHCPCVQYTQICLTYSMGRFTKVCPKRMRTEGVLYGCVTNISSLMHLGQCARRYMQVFITFGIVNCQRRRAQPDNA